MHYYKFNIADYRKDTGHLSVVEHGIYRQLLDWYYLDETPIPLETQVVIRRLRLGSSSDTVALQSVLSDFFIEEKDGFRHARCDEEIAEYHRKADKNRENGKRGGRPKASAGKEENHLGFSGLAKHNPTESETNPNHKPLTINQEVNNIPADAGIDLKSELFDYAKLIGIKPSLIGKAIKEVGEIETMAALEQSNGLENPTNAFAASIRNRKAKIEVAGEVAEMSKPKRFDPSVLSI